MPPPRQPRRRRIGLLLGGTALLIAAGWTIAWQVVTLRVEAAVEGWIEQRRAFGERIEHGPMTLGGYPFTVAVTLREVHWAREDGPTLLTAAAPEVTATAAVWDPLRVTVRPAAGGRASAAGAWGALTADADVALAVVALGRDGVEGIDLTLRNLDLTGPGGEKLAQVEAADAMIDPRPEPASGAVAAVPATLEISGRATGVQPAGAEGLPFDGPASVTWRAVLRGPLDPTAGVPGLVQWRDAGGVIDVHHLGVAWHPVDLVGDGTLALDAALRPEGAGVAEVVGVGEAIDRLVAQGRVKPAQAALLKLAAIAASQPAPDGGQRLKAPVSVQDGTLRIGQLAIARVGSIAR